MANSNLQGRSWNIPIKMNKHLNRIFNAYKGPNNVEGWERLSNLVTSDTVSYEQMKRMKNFFDTFEGENNETPYILNGGTKVKNWINKKLGDSRDGIENKKKSMKNVGMRNQYQKDRLSTPSGKSDPHKSQLKRTMGEQEVRKINNLIKHINKNKQLWEHQIT